MNKYEVEVTWEMKGTVRIESESELTVDELTEIVDDQSLRNLSYPLVDRHQSGPFQIESTGHLQPCGGCGKDSWWVDDGKEHVCKTGPEVTE